MKYCLLILMILALITDLVAEFSLGAHYIIEYDQITYRAVNTDNGQAYYSWDSALDWGEIGEPIFQEGERDLVFTSIYSPKYEQVRFQVMEKSSGQLYYMWSGDEEWNKLGNPIIAEGNASFDMFAFWSSRYDQTATKAINTQTGEVYYFWDGDEDWYYLGGTIEPEKDAEFQLIASYSSDYDQILFRAINNLDGSLYYMWESDREWIKDADAINSEYNLRFSLSPALKGDKIYGVYCLNTNNGQAYEFGSDGWFSVGNPISSEFDNNFVLTAVFNEKSEIPEFVVMDKDNGQLHFSLFKGVIWETDDTTVIGKRSWQIQPTGGGLGGGISLPD